MLTSQDIQKLVSVLATKEDVRLVQSDIKDLKETIQELAKKSRVT